MIKRVFQESIDYLNALGPAKLVKLFSSLGMERLSYITSKIEKKRILDTLKKSDIDKSLKLMKPLDNEEIVFFMKFVKTSDLVHILKNVDIQDIEAWNRAVPVKESHRLLQSIGAAKSAHFLKRMGGVKAGAVWNILKTDRMLQLVTSLGYREAAYLGKSIPLPDIVKWLKRKGIDDIPRLVHYLGSENIVEMHGILGIEKSIKVFDSLTPEEVIILSRQMKKMNYPRLSPKSVLDMKKWHKRLKKKRAGG